MNPGYDLSRHRSEIALTGSSALIAGILAAPLVFWP